jgi:hypothetical protein
MSNCGALDNSVFESYLAQNNPAFHTIYSSSSLDFRRVDTAPPELQGTLQREVDRFFRVIGVYMNANEDWAREILDYRYPFGFKRGRSAIDLFLNDPEFCNQEYVKTVTGWQYEFKIIIETLLYVTYFMFSELVSPKRRTTFQIGEYKGRRMDDVFREDRLYCQKFLITPDPDNIMAWIEDRQSLLAVYEFRLPSYDGDRTRSFRLKDHELGFSETVEPNPVQMHESSITAVGPKTCTMDENDAVMDEIEAMAEVEKRKFYRAKRPRPMPENVGDDETGPVYIQPPMEIKKSDCGRPGCFCFVKSEEDLVCKTTKDLNCVDMKKVFTVNDAEEFKRLKAAVTGSSMKDIVANMGVLFRGFQYPKELKTVLTKRTPVVNNGKTTNFFLKNIHGGLPNNRVFSVDDTEVLANLEPNGNVFFEFSNMKSTKIICFELRRTTKDLVLHHGGKSRVVRGPGVNEDVRLAEILSSM